MAQLIRLELTLALVGLAIAAKLQGVALSDPWLAEAVILTGLFLAAATGIFLGRVIVRGLLGWMISWGTIWLALVIVSETLSFRATILPQGTFYKVTDPAAVTIETHAKGKREIWVTATNNRHDWLQNAVVICQLFYDNGSEIARRYTYGLANGYLAEGASVSKRVISRQELQDHRADPARTECQLKYAQFMQRPTEEVEIQLSYDRRHWRHVFTLTNRSDRTLSEMLIQCMDENGINQTIRTVCRWESDPRHGPVLKPGDKAQLLTQGRSFVALDECAVLSLRRTAP
jgi:hypothetical protein